jgi:hypothetical protein
MDLNKNYIKCHIKNVFTGNEEFVKKMSVILEVYVPMEL